MDYTALSGATHSPSAERCRKFDLQQSINNARCLIYSVKCHNAKPPSRRDNVAADGWRDNEVLVGAM